MADSEFVDDEDDDEEEEKMLEILIKCMINEVYTLVNVFILYFFEKFLLSFSLMMMIKSSSSSFFAVNYYSPRKCTQNFFLLIQVFTSYLF